MQQIVEWFVPKRNKVDQPTLSKKWPFCKRPEISLTKPIYDIIGNMLSIRWLHFIACSSRCIRSGTIYLNEPPEYGGKYPSESTIGFLGKYAIPEFQYGYLAGQFTPIGGGAVIIAE